jgi:hypothetical protein
VGSLHAYVGLITLEDLYEYEISNCNSRWHNNIVYVSNALLSATIALGDRRPFLILPFEHNISDNVSRSLIIADPTYQKNQDEQQRPIQNAMSTLGTPRTLLYCITIIGCYNLDYYFYQCRST